MKNRSRIPMIAMILIATLVLGAGAGALAYSTFGSSSTVVRQVPVQRSEPAAQTTPLTVGQVYKNAYRAVVEITVTSDKANPFGGEQQQQRAQGSGFVVDDSGHIVTNDHVVDGSVDRPRSDQGRRAAVGPPPDPVRGLRQRAGR